MAIRSTWIAAAVACASAWGLAASPARASLVTYCTENSAFMEAGNGTVSNSGHTITFSDGQSTFTLTFNPIAASAPMDVNTPQTISLGTFSLTQTGNPATVSAPTNDFTLRIDQTGPTSGSGTDVGNLTGSFQSNSHAGQIDFTSSTIVISSVTYALRGLTGTGSHHVLQLPTSGQTLSLDATVTGGGGTAAVPEPSTLAMVSTSVPLFLGFWRKRRRDAA